MIKVNAFLRSNARMGIIACSCLLSGCTSTKTKNPDLVIPASGEAANQATKIQAPEVLQAGPPLIEGKNWTGYYYRTDKPGRLAITAEIKQKKNEIKLTTSKEDNKVHTLEGRISNDGQLQLEDKLQPTIWTSSYGAVTIKSLKIVALIGEEGKSASQIITLRR